jgi:hypothetical protein
VDLQRCDGDKVLVGNVPAVVRVDGLDELGEFGGVSWRCVESDEAAADVGGGDNAFF